MAESASVSRILVVDDHADTTRIIARFLGEEGFDITKAGSLREALELCRAKSFDLLLTDLSLGDGTGVELLKAIRQTSAMRAVLMTGWQSDEQEAQLRAAGFDELMVKPVLFSKLLKIIRDLPANPPQAPGHPPASGSNPGSAKYC